jgi:hypothetical protein
METIILNIKDKSKSVFLMELLKQFDFVEVIQKSTKINKDKKYSLFDSAGLWEGRGIDSKELRNNSWKLNQ